MPIRSVFLPPTLNGYHKASGYMYREVVLPRPSEIPRIMQLQNNSGQKTPDTTEVYPIVRKSHFLADIIASLVSCKNPTGTDTNSDLELEDRVFHHTRTMNCFEIWERTNLTQTYNTAVL